MGHIKWFAIRQKTAQWSEFWVRHHFVQVRHECRRFTAIRRPRHIEVWWIILGIEDWGLLFIKKHVSVCKMFAGERMQCCKVSTFPIYRNFCSRSGFLSTTISSYVLFSSTRIHVSPVIYHQSVMIHEIPRNRRGNSPYGRECSRSKVNLFHGFSRAYVASGRLLNTQVPLWAARWNNVQVSGVNSLIRYNVHHALGGEWSNWSRVNYLIPRNPWQMRMHLGFYLWIPSHATRLRITLKYVNEIGCFSIYT